MEELHILINRYLEIQEDKEDIFGVLHFVQSKLGYIPKDIQKYIADKMNIDLSEIIQTIEISSYFTEKKSSVKIVVCNGSACSFKGSRFILEELSKELGINVDDENSDILLTTKRCFGACSYGINVEINGELIHNVTVSGLKDVLNKILLIKKNMLE